MDLIVFILSFGVILFGCELFTNGVEWTGKRFRLSEGAVGSVLAAVGTALPETIIPLIAILAVGGRAGEDIGVGAILGSPFMLSTVALCVCGLSVLLFIRRRGTKALHASGKLIRRDLKFFLLAYGLAAIAAIAPPEYNLFKAILGFTLIPFYIVYTVYALKTGEISCGEEEELKDLYLDSLIQKCAGKPVERPPEATNCDPPAFNSMPGPSTLLIALQVLASLGLIIAGANLFVGQIEEIAIFLNINPLILALIVSPMATELPEMFNSFLWIREKKDTFAIGNITGAMVYQSCIPVTIGLVLTGWHLDISGKTGFLQGTAICIALLSSMILYAESGHNKIKIPGLMIGGLLYILFIALILLNT